MQRFKRPLLPFVLAYVAGCCVVHDFAPLMGEGVLWLFLITSLIAAAWAHRRGEGKWVWWLVACGVVGVVVVQLEAERRALAIHILDQTVDGVYYPATGRIAEIADTASGERRQVVLSDVSVQFPQQSPVTLPGRVQVSSKSAGLIPLTLSVGDRVRFYGSFSEPALLHNFFGNDQGESLAGRGVYVRALLDAPLIPDGSSAGLGLAVWSVVRQVTASIREHCAVVLRNNMSPTTADLTTAMVFNDRSVMSDEDARAFRDSNTIHLFAVSGMHVAMFSLIVGVLLGVAGVRRRSGMLVLMVILSVYILMIGMSPAPLRAYLIAAAMAAGWWLRREVDGWSALLLAFAIIVAVNPLSLWNAGLQLSLAGVAGIFIFERPLRELLGESKGEISKLRRAGRFVWAALVVSLAATIMVLPLQLHYFSQVNLLSPLANLLACPISGLVLGGALATILAGMVFPPLGLVFGAATSGGMELLRAIAYATASAKWAIVTPGSLPAWAVIAYYVVLLAGFYVVVRDTPEWLPKSRARLAVHGGAALVVLMLSLGMRFSGGKLRVWFLDVGQGDSALVEFPNGRTLLIDAGRAWPNVARYVIQPHLMARSAVPLGMLVATHADNDHTGGMPELLRSHAVREIGFAGVGKDLGETWSVAVNKGVKPLPLHAGMVLDGGSGARVEVVWPPADAPDLNDNERSVVLRIVYGEVRILLTGDAGILAEAGMAKEVCQADVLKVGHHGSKSSTSEEFLRKVRPSVAVVSCGKNNSYGHPNKESLERLMKAGCEVCRTDEQGAVLVEASRGRFSVQTVKGVKAGRVW